MILAATFISGHCDDIHKAVFNWQRLKIIISSRALFNLAARDFASRGSIFSTCWQFRSEEVTAVMVWSDALLALVAKSGRVLPIMARRAR